MTWDPWFYFPPKEDVLQIFSPLKIIQPQLGLNPQTLGGPVVQHATTKPSKVTLKISNIKTKAMGICGSNIQKVKTKVTGK
jgi:hypothetical protein